MYMFNSIKSGKNIYLSVVLKQLPLNCKYMVLPNGPNPGASASSGSLLMISLDIPLDLHFEILLVLLIFF